MLHWFLSLPWPTWDHLFQYFVVLVIFFGPKKLLDWVLDKEWKWVQKYTLSAQRKAEILWHTREHGGRLEGCAECEALIQVRQ